jgi:hypothetical protein
MAYNEPDYIPIWIKYYASQVGARNLFIVDHGSDDDSTSGLGDVNILRIPRTPQDDGCRAAFLSEFCASLLCWYECVIHVDVDEIAVADPRYARDLITLCSEMSQPVLNAIGVNVLHRMDHDVPFDPARGVLVQRPWMFCASALSKPILIRNKVTWAPGFHSADAPAAFGNLYLFHLRWFDLGIALRRLAKTRAMPWHHPDAGGHQRGSDDAMVQQFYSFSKLLLDERDIDAAEAAGIRFYRCSTTITGWARAAYLSYYT